MHEKNCHKQRKKKSEQKKKQKSMLKRLFCILSFISSILCTLNTLCLLKAGALNVNVHRIRDEMDKTTTHPQPVQRFSTDCRNNKRLFRVFLLFLSGCYCILRSIVRTIIVGFYRLNGKKKVHQKFGGNCLPVVACSFVCHSIEYICINNN